MHVHVRACACNNEGFLKVLPRGTYKLRGSSKNTIKRETKTENGYTLYYNIFVCWNNVCTGYKYSNVSMNNVGTMFPRKQEVHFK